jgi:DNA-binding NarL/FixJ family response regulator
MTEVPHKLRVVIADDDERVRQDFAALLELEPDIEVVGIAADGLTAVDLCLRVNPHVVVMDIRMPGLNGIDATAHLRVNNPPTSRVLVVTTFDLDEYVLSAARAGASGFLLKDQAPDQLAEAVRIVAAGDAIVSPRATARLLREFATPSNQPAITDMPLSEREVEIVRLMAQGMSNEDIARVAFVSIATVKTHVSSVLSKLGLQSRLQIVVWAYDTGTVSAGRTDR